MKVPDPSHSDALDRRGFLSGSGAALGALWLGLVPVLEACGRDARTALEEGLPYRALSPDEAAALDALTARIVPTDETPGAREAGVVRFIDQVFAEGHLPGIDGPVRAFVGLADGVARERGAAAYHELPEAAQDAVLAELAEGNTPFGVLRFLTLAGLLSDPSYGGNRDGVGWRMIGFEMASGWQPPFGTYDRLRLEAEGGA